jgi:HAD superfamily hydrolase (TIGR01509 family)
MAYRAILFDLFDTLVSFDRTRLPTVQVNGRVVHSTVGCLHEVFRPHAPQVTLEALYQAMLDSWQEAERRRAVDHREVAAPERFAQVFRYLALDPRACPPEVMQGLLDVHRRALSRAAEFPAHHRPLLADLGQHHRLAVVSNFDYTPTALGILDAAGVTGLFEAIVISDAVGWRKPAPAIFRVALERLDVEPAQALFVGDRADIDVAGAQSVGMPVAWINRDRETLPGGMAPPDFEIHDLDELRRIPGVAERI